MPVRAVGERIHRAAAGASHSEQKKIEEIKANLRAYADDPQCGKSGAINEVERILATQKQNLKKAERAGEVLAPRENPILSDALSKAATGEAKAVGLAKKYKKGSLGDVKRHVHSFRKAVKTYVKDQRTLESLLLNGFAKPLIRDAGSAHSCAKKIIGFVAIADRAGGTSGAGGGAAHVVPPILSATAVALDGCYFTTAHVQEVSKYIDSVNEFLRLSRKISEDMDTVEHRSKGVDKAIENAIHDASIVKQKEVKNLRATIDAAVKDVRRSYAIAQPIVTPQLREGLQQAVEHMQSDVSVVATCAKKLGSLNGRVKLKLPAGS